MKKLTVLVVVLVGLSCRTPEGPTRRTSAPDGSGASRPTAPGPANLAFTCVQPRVGCDPTGYAMTVLGDVPRCEVMGPGSLRLELSSSNASNDKILIAFEGYSGPGRYVLNDPARKFLTVSDGVTWNGCDGPAQVSKVVTAGDPNCPSPACTVQVSEDTPDAPFPRPLTFSVHCESLCENGAAAICQGPFDFITRVTCG